MRCCMKLFAIVLALIAFSPIQAMAKGGPGGGGGGGGRRWRRSRRQSVGQHARWAARQQGSQQHVGVGGNAGFNRSVQPNTGLSQGQAATQHQAFDAHKKAGFLRWQRRRPQWLALSLGQRPLVVLGTGQPVDVVRR